MQGQPNPSQDAELDEVPLQLVQPRPADGENGEQLPMTGEISKLIRELWPEAVWNDSLIALWKTELGKYPEARVIHAIGLAKRQKPWKQPEISWVLDILGPPETGMVLSPPQLVVDIEIAGAEGATYVRSFRVASEDDGRALAKKMGGVVVNQIDDAMAESRDSIWILSADRAELREVVGRARERRWLSSTPLDPDPEKWSPYVRVAVTMARNHPPHEDTGH